MFKRLITSIIFLLSIIFTGFLTFNIGSKDIQIQEIVTSENDKSTQIVLNSPVVERFKLDSIQILNDENIRGYIGFSALFDANTGWRISNREEKGRCGNEPIYFEIKNEDIGESVQISVYDRTHNLKDIWEDLDIVVDPLKYSKRDRSRVFIPRPLNSAEIRMRNYDELDYTFSQGNNDFVYGYGQIAKLKDEEYKLNYNVITFKEDFFIHFGCYNIAESNKEVMIEEMHKMLGSIELKNHLL